MAYEYIVNEGIIIPDTATTRTEIEAEYRAALGEDLPLDPSTPQGVLITMETESRDAVARVSAEVANQINPDISGGVWLDAIWNFLGGKRKPAERSILNDVELAGIPGTPIPLGSLASVTATGDLFRTTSAVTLDMNGEAVVSFEAVEPGAIAVAAHGLDVVASSVLGWETVDNPTIAQVGRPAESDIASRRRRRRTLALQGVSVPEAIQSAVWDLPGVRSMSFYENITDAPITFEGVNLVAHSIYACVDGGNDDDIAMALLENKTLGAAWNGASHPVTEPTSGQVYDVKFDRPTELTLFVRVTARKNPLALAQVIPAALMQYADGELEGDSGLDVGKDISPFELAAAINQVYPTIFVQLVETSFDGSTWSSAVRPVMIDEVARLTTSRVIVVIV
jgi:uncharacterized phage protein gp47/JayE